MYIINIQLNDNQYLYYIANVDNIARLQIACTSMLAYSHGLKWAKKKSVTKLNTS